MTEIIKETITTQPATPKREATGSQTAEYGVYFFFGILETLLAFRIILKVMGANMASTFVDLIYGITKVFIWPFEGIFRRAFTQGIETTSVFEPSTLVALIVYPVLAWGIIKLIHLLSGKEQTA